MRWFLFPHMHFAMWDEVALYLGNLCMRGLIYTLSAMMMKRPDRFSYTTQLVEYEFAEIRKLTATTRSMSAAKLMGSPLLYYTNDTGVLASAILVSVCELSKLDVTAYHMSSLFLMWYLHDDVIKWKHFRVTGPLWGQCHRQIPPTKASDAELWCFLWSPPEQTVEQTTETLVIWDAIAFLMTSL